MSFKGFLWRALLTLILLVVLYQVWIFIQICWWIDHNPSRSSFMKSTLAEMQAATGWQGHSVRGAMAGSLKKQGLQVTNEKTEDRGRVWRLAAQKA